VVSRSGLRCGVDVTLSTCSNRVPHTNNIYKRVVLIVWRTMVSGRTQPL
jgi:hypothetical protein